MLVTSKDLSLGQSVLLTNAGTFNVGGSLASDGRITGAGGLIETGAGILFVANANNAYSGDTTIQAGTLQIDDVRALGADTHTLKLTGGTLATSIDLVLGNKVSLTNKGTFKVTTSL